MIVATIRIDICAKLVAIFRLACIGSILQGHTHRSIRFEIVIVYGVHRKRH